MEVELEQWPCPICGERVADRQTCNDCGRRVGVCCMAGHAITVCVECMEVSVAQQQQPLLRRYWPQYIELENKALFAALSLRNMSYTQRMSKGLAMALRGIAGDLEKAAGHN
jgi:hypothetical protein